MVAGLLVCCAACGSGAQTGAAQILAARLSGEPEPVLVADLKLRFTPTMLEALDHGVPLRLEFELHGRGARGTSRLRSGLTLRFLPLAQQYQLVDDSGLSSRSFARRSQLLAGLDRVRVPLGPEWSARGGALLLTVDLDRSALPGPLRLPALLEPQWQMRAAEYTWTDGA